jgi:hypothetical protein
LCHFDEKKDETKKNGPIRSSMKRVFFPAIVGNVVTVLFYCRDFQLFPFVLIVSHAYSRLHET